GGWGGRDGWRQFYGESHPSWTQGGDSYPGRDSSRDTVIGVDGKPHTSDQATIWRWRTAFQHDFAARMDWTIKDVPQANHNPRVVINGQGGKAPLIIEAHAGKAVTLDASASTDPDGNTLRYAWSFYAEAGTGIPTQPVFAVSPFAAAAGGNRNEGGIPSAPTGGPRQPRERVTIQDADQA